MLKVFNHYISSHTLAQASLDMMLLGLAVVIATALQVDMAASDWRGVMYGAALFAAIMILLNSLLGLYRLSSVVTPRDVLVRALLGISVSVPLAYLLTGWLPGAAFHEDAIKLSALALLVSIVLMRAVLNRRQVSALFARRALVVGSPEECAEVAEVLSRPAAYGIELVGTHDGKSAAGEGASLFDTVRRDRVGQIILASRERRGGVLPLRELLDCRLHGVRVTDMTGFFEQINGQVRVDLLKASWLILGDGFRQGWMRSTVKRLSDLLAASVLLVAAAPVMLLTMLAILLEDGAPVFYRQERVGQGGRVFKVIKFRSMRRDAEGDGRPRWATSNDDRITIVGRFIRKTRIDELPQLFNVFVGDMSMVGPRPERPYFVDKLTDEIPFYAVRHSVKPGVTGWAQVRYQYGASVDDAVKKLQYDLYYVKNHTLLLDTLVLFETVRVVLTGEGAN